jgi:hypothetical protein
MTQPGVEPVVVAFGLCALSGGLVGTIVTWLIMRTW